MADKDGSSLDHERMIVLDVDDDSDDVSPSAVSPVRMTSAKSTTSMSSRFKGVVPQPNGRWGAQIYEKHHRVWLGTFDTESDAARSYDVAARRFRGGEAITNFSQTAVDDAEAEFLSSRSKAEIVDMLRKHTYSEELLQSCRRRVLGGPAGGQKKRTSADVGREELFEKAVTPSDVGKLNRLVIPKQHAEKHFPLKPASLLLSFEDVSNGKVWRFRYSYWNSSQSYVLTKGWSRFVKEKGLNAGDLVLFHRSIGPEKQIFIECKSSSSSSAPVIRLFGVNISQVLDQVQGSCGCRNNQTTTTTTRRRRRRDQMERLPLHNLVKKQCVRDLQ